MNNLDAMHLQVTRSARALGLQTAKLALDRDESRESPSESDHIMVSMRI